VVWKVIRHLPKPGALSVDVLHHRVTEAQRNQGKEQTLPFEPLISV
jgi:hypothetical protein